MWPSHDINWDTIVDLTTLGVVDLDTLFMPDVFGLREFDSREPVVWLLPGDFRNTISVGDGAQGVPRYHSGRFG